MRKVRLEGLIEGSRQGDRGFIDLLERVGAQVSWSGDALCVSGRPGSGVEVDLSNMPDQVPTLAAVAPFLRGETVIRNVAHLRVKESDRLAVMARELRRTGVRVAELDDGLIIQGDWHDSPPPATEVRIDPEDDHRIAMSMALVGLRRPGVVIDDASVVGKSYPHFWRDLDTLVGM